MKQAEFLLKANIYHNGEYTDSADIATDYFYITTETDGFPVDSESIAAAVDWLRDGDTAAVWLEIYDHVDDWPIPTFPKLFESEHIFINARGEVLAHLDEETPLR